MQDSSSSSVYLTEANWTESYLNSQFAKAIAAKSKGEWEAQKKLYQPFKSSFLVDPINNPAISNTHICYEYDAQYKEADKSWSKPGYAFSKQPRFQDDVESKDDGPGKPVEFDHFFEKPQKVFGRKRVIRPFSRVQMYHRSVEPNVAQTLEKENPVIGPTTYDPHIDTWSLSSKPVCGVVKPSPAFCCPSREEFQGGLFDPTKQYLTKNRAKQKTDDSTVAVSELTSMIQRPGTVTTGARTRSTNPTTNVSSSMSDLHSTRIYDKRPGFTFLRGAKNKLDTHTGTTNADVVFRRAELPKGGNVVIQISAQDEGKGDILPDGARWKTGWGTVERDAELFDHLEVSASSPFMHEVQETERALLSHPQSPGTPIRPGSGEGRQGSRANSPFTFRLPDIQSPNNLPSSHVRMPSSDRLNFGPPVYLSKRIKQIEHERAIRQQLYYAAHDSDVNSLGSLSRSVVEGDASVISYTQPPNTAGITMPPRIADVIPYQPDAVKIQHKAASARRQQSPQRLRSSQSSPQLPAYGTYRPDKLGAVVSAKQKYDSNAVLSLSNESLFS